mmetsp:Transcript_91806/g.264147  ORF Transcript_91806/g.264147 Transcript_91806/m.264147 type:complete len:207 (+) Transcript_91806:524-1144(+)
MRRPRGVSLRWRPGDPQSRRAFLLFAAADEGRALGLGEDDLALRTRQSEHLADALESAARAVARDPVVELQAGAGEGRQDLRPRRLLVVSRVRLGLELAGEKKAVLRGKLLSLLHHACAAERRRRDDNLRAEHAHDLATLHGEGSGDDGDEFVAALGADHGQCDAGVAARGLDHGAAGLQLAAGLRSFDDRQRKPILHRAQGVEIL